MARPVSAKRYSIVLGVIMSPAYGQLPFRDLALPLPEMDRSREQVVGKCPTPKADVPEGIVTTQSFWDALPKGNVSIYAVPLTLEDTCLKALISSRVYTDKNLSEQSHYGIGVEAQRQIERCEEGEGKPNCTKESIWVSIPVFLRGISREEVGEYFVGRSISEIVSFDESTGIVTFSINGQVLRYDSRNHVAM